jgi:hypothetical protein
MIAGPFRNGLHAGARVVTPEVHAAQQTDPVV